MTDNVIYCNNAMLNLPGFNSTAATSIKLSMGDSPAFGGNDKEYKPSLSGSLCISDCNRVIELDLYASDKEEYTNAIYKLKILNRIIKEALASIESKQTEFNDKWDRVDAREKQERLDKKANGE